MQQRFISSSLWERSSLLKHILPLQIGRFASIVGSHRWKVYGFCLFAHRLLNDPLWCPCGLNGLGKVGHRLGASNRWKWMKGWSRYFFCQFGSSFTASNWISRVFHETRALENENKKIRVSQGERNWQDSSRHVFFFWIEIERHWKNNVDKSYVYHHTPHAQTDIMRYIYIYSLAITIFLCRHERASVIYSVMMLENNYECRWKLWNIITTCCSLLHILQAGLVSLQLTSAFHGRIVARCPFSGICAGAPWQDFLGDAAGSSNGNCPGNEICFSFRKVQTLQALIRSTISKYSKRWDIQTSRRELYGAVFPLFMVKIMPKWSTGYNPFHFLQWFSLPPSASRHAMTLPEIRWMAVKSVSPVFSRCWSSQDLSNRGIV